VSRMCGLSKPLLQAVATTPPPPPLQMVNSVKHTCQCFWQRADVCATPSPNPQSSKQPDHVQLLRLRNHICCCTTTMSS
jgi:hypothetical protein